MRNSWENETVRPIPLAIVDSGNRYGYVPLCVVGAAEHIAPDSKPQLDAKAEDQNLRLKEE
eukprot:CAMPEP_0194435422 /NCGR_PEP_ID=MMETSP0176-20130528/88607_1 /TAXON_ID=216777 /ORGANISM="Proboscia alata, Strain PI-D3" /LENGTH=60 /DNA_ID=CAMNT_0039254699 /DNA_START=358 /DNA_END=537 /DNA_ORIENTATION=+